MCHRPQVFRFLHNSEGVGISSSIFGFSVDDRFTQTVILTGGTFRRLAKGEICQELFMKPSCSSIGRSPSLIGRFVVGCSGIIK